MGPKKERLGARRAGRSAGGEHFLRPVVFVVKAIAGPGRLRASTKEAWSAARAGPPGRRSTFDAASASPDAGRRSSDSPDEECSPGRARRPSAIARVEDRAAGVRGRRRPRPPAVAAEHVDQRPVTASTGIHPRTPFPISPPLRRLGAPRLSGSRAPQASRKRSMRRGAIGRGVSRRAGRHPPARTGGPRRDLTPGQGKGGLSFSHPFAAHLADSGKQRRTLLVEKIPTTRASGPKLYDSVPQPASGAEGLRYCSPRHPDASHRRGWPIDLDGAAPASRGRYRAFGCGRVSP